MNFTKALNWLGSPQVKTISTDDSTVRVTAELTPGPSKLDKSKSSVPARKASVGEKSKIDEKNLRPNLSDSSRSKSVMITASEGVRTMKVTEVCCAGKRRNCSCV